MADQPSVPPLGNVGDVASFLHRIPLFQPLSEILREIGLKGKEFYERAVEILDEQLTRTDATSANYKDLVTAHGLCRLVAANTPPLSSLGQVAPLETRVIADSYNPNDPPRFYLI